jgi:glutathione S-transferase
MTEEDVGAVHKSLNDDVLPKDLARFEKLLEHSPSGWIAGGDGPSIADFILVPRLQWLAESGVNSPLSPAVLDNFPYIRDLIAKFMELPAVEMFNARHP